MEINATKVVKVNAKTLKVYCKVRDCGSYTLFDETGAVLRDAEESYVPGFMPGQHYGDYLILEIDIDTGRITNRKAPTAQQIEEFIEGDD